MKRPPQIFLTENRGFTLTTGQLGSSEKNQFKLLLDQEVRYVVLH